MKQPARKADELFLDLMVDLSRRVSNRTTHDLIEAANILRRMLLDKHSILEIVSRHLGYRPFFTVRDTTSDPPIPQIAGSILHYDASVLDPGIFATAPIRHLQTNTFLRMPILTAFDKHVTVKDLIKYCCVKAGAVHLDTATEPEYNRIEKIVIAVSVGNRALLEVLLHQLLKSFVRTALPIWRELVRLPSPGKRLSHYAVGTGQSIFFKAKHFMTTEGMSGRVADGIVWSAYMLIRPENLQKTRRWIYHLAGPAGERSFSFDITFSRSAPVAASFVSSGGPRLRVSAPPAVGGLLEGFVQITVWLNMQPGSVTLSIFIDGREAATHSDEAEMEKIDPSRQVLGADARGRRGGVFQMKELLIHGGNLTNEDLMLLDRYFDFRKGIERLQGSV